LLKESTVLEQKLTEQNVPKDMKDTLVQFYKDCYQNIFKQEIAVLSNERVNSSLQNTPS
jgi:hypothetical protein